MVGEELRPATCLDGFEEVYYVHPSVFESLEEEISDRREVL